MTPNDKRTILIKHGKLSTSWSELGSWYAQYMAILDSKHRPPRNIAYTWGETEDEAIVQLYRLVREALWKQCSRPRK